MPDFRICDIFLYKKCVFFLHKICVWIWTEFLKIPVAKEYKPWNGLADNRFFKSAIALLLKNCMAKNQHFSTRLERSLNITGKC